jgi:hypothetical protein
MKIAFLLGSTTISGGTNVILEHATRLRDRGDNVFLLTEKEASADDLNWHSDANGLQVMSLEMAKREQFDCALATWWQSVPLLSQVNASSYIYFVQSIESRFFPEEDNDILVTRDIDVLKQWIESTSRYPLPVITEASWIQHYLRTKYNHNPVLVRNGIRKDIYVADGPVIEARHPERLRVLVEGPLGVFYKNVEKTIELCNAAGIDDIWLLTSSDVNESPGVNRCFSRVSTERTADIYRSCDVLVKLSTVEGMFGPPLEMFHCGGTAIVYDVTGYDEYIVHRKNSLVVNAGDEKKVIDYLKELNGNVELLNGLKKGALETAAAWPDWQSSSKDFASAVEELSGQEHFVTKQLLEEHNKYFLSLRENSFRACEMQRLAERESNSSAPAVQRENFIQVYWHEGEGFSNECMVSTKYRCGEWTTCSIEIPKSCSQTIQLRVDPSVRIGVVMIKRISLTEKVSGREYDCWENEEIVSKLYITGTARIVRREPYPVLVCYGEDPQIVLPQIIADQLKHPMILEIELKEMGFAGGLSCKECWGPENRGEKNTIISKLLGFLSRSGRAFLS